MYPFNHALKKLVFNYRELFHKKNEKGEVEDTEFPKGGEEIACRIPKD